MARSLRVVALGDTHCGHIAGLTAPPWQWRPNRDNPLQTKIALGQREAWRWYAAKVEALSPVDGLFVLGDTIDGPGDKSGGVEQITVDRSTQVEMAVEALRLWQASRVSMVHGTPYHTGNAEDWEDEVCVKLRQAVSGCSCKIGDHEWVSPNGTVVDLKHFVSASVIPHGRHTALSRDRLQNILWSLNKQQPSSQLFLRGHVHYHALAGGVAGGRPWAAMTVPALQLPRTRHGGRKCSGPVDYGLMLFEFFDAGGFRWELHLAPVALAKATAEKW